MVKHRNNNYTFCTFVAWNSQASKKGGKKSPTQKIRCYMVVTVLKLPCTLGTYFESLEADRNNLLSQVILRMVPKYKAVSRLLQPWYLVQYIICN